jgi:glycopeptide antibiotics resistance protein
MANNEVLGKIPLQGSWIIQVKDQLAKLRLLLHSLLLFAPALGMAVFVGRKPAIALAIGLAISIEAAQTGFGYGFDRFDVIDLAYAAVGIALAMWVYRKVLDRAARPQAAH